MDPTPSSRPKNPLAGLSLVVGCLTIAIMLASCGVMWAPKGFGLAVLSLPFQLVLASLSLTTGLIGYRRAVLVAGDRGRGTAMVGVGAGLAWFLVLGLLLSLGLAGTVSLVLLAALVKGP